MMTKEQERKALEKIRKILAEAGEESYIGWAFAGCVETAENNIENDFADSMQSKLEMADDAIHSMKTQIEELKAENEKLKAENEKLNAVQISDESKERIRWMVGDKLVEQRERMKISEKTILEEIENDKSEDFISARADYINSKKAVERYRNMYEEIDKAWF